MSEQKLFQTDNLNLDINNEGVAHQDATKQITEYSQYDLQLDDPKELITKQMIWERKLLDFSLRNNLLNTRLGRKVVPFISFEIEHLEDHLQNNEDYEITPSPDKQIEPNDDGMYNSRHQASEYKSFVPENIKSNKIISYLTDAELQRSLTYIYRTARTSLEENGANSLFLALGMLKWFENTKSEQPRYAPILLLPVDIIRKNGNKYVIRKRDEDIILNITLVELLKQGFKIDLDILKDLPTDEYGVDVKKTFTYFRQAIIEQKKWDVLEESMLGLFSFNKFVMWNDIHSNADLLAKNAIVASLIENRALQEDSTEMVDARIIDKTTSPADFSIPLDVDSSQMEAIVESGRGRSFILHGPPGTGKSQTITNMIANALYQGRRVLFVAEKMAALSVVQSRLEKIGLAPFCLELHSNKATKKHFLEQMAKALNVTKIKEPAEYASKAEELLAERKSLINYMDALHQKGNNDLSLYDCISAYLSIQQEEISDGLPEKELLTADFINNCKNQVEQLDTILSIVSIPQQHPLYGLEPIDNRMDTLDSIKQLLKLYGQTLTTYAQVLPSYHDDIIRIDVRRVRREWKDIQDKWFIPRYFAKKRFLKNFQIFGYVDASNVDVVFDLIEDYRCQHNAYLKYIEAHKAHSEQNNSQSSGYILDLFKQLKDIKNKLASKTYSRNSSEEIISSMDRWLNNYHQMKDWYLWTAKKQELCQMSLQTIAARLEKGEKPQDIIPAFIKGIYSYLISITIDEDEQLRTFNSKIFRQKIEQYKRDTLKFQELSKKELYCKLASRVPSSSTATVDGSEISILKRNITNGGRGNSIRTIIDNIPTLLPRLCPCMLMSPISVAQYIDLKSKKFDLVIFDEASQMPTCEAVGAIARGKALIVVGDSKQMPPTSFFSSTQVDDDEADIDDMESILDDCKTLSLREYYLSWHYRSKHESLIAFSNSQYYDNHLFTFPSVDDQVAKVKLIPVEGVYDKGRTRSNPEESKAIVKEIIRRLSDPELRKYSIGVVSFSKVQGDRIEDDLTEELDKNPELKDIAYNSPEPIFIKNLENVQGDERDIILFSIGYGTDKDGNVSMNFGPLNNVGGERRLNVAVSRARYEMLVYSTLKSDQIDLRRSQAKGVEGLKGFLEYAETGCLPMMNGSLHETEKNIIINQICEMLNSQGYIAKQCIGRSNFKIDIAVSTNKNPEKYILGILCDGKNYYETKTTRDREIVQPNILKMLGWRIIRVYSIDWYENHEQSAKNILDELRDIEISDTKNTTEEVLPLKEFNSDNIQKDDILIEPTKNQGQMPYIEAEVKIPVINKAEYKPSAGYNTKVIRQIISKEQPITESYLCKRVARLFGFGHAGANVQKAVAIAAHNFYRDPLALNGEYSLWINEECSKNYQSYRSPSPRSITEIPVCEVMNAIHEVFSEEFSLPKDKIPTATARKLGFSNAGSKIAETINTILDMMLQKGDIKEVNGMSSINT